MGAKARDAKSKARLDAYDKLFADARAADEAAKRLEIAIPPCERLGELVIEVEGLSKAYGDRLPIEDLSF